MDKEYAFIPGYKLIKFTDSKMIFEHTNPVNWGPGIRTVFIINTPPLIFLYQYYSTGEINRGLELLLWGFVGICVLFSVLIWWSLDRYHDISTVYDAEARTITTTANTGKTNVLSWDDLISVGIQYVQTINGIKFLNCSVKSINNRADHINLYLAYKAEEAAIEVLKFLEKHHACELEKSARTAIDTGVIYKPSLKEYFGF